MKYRWLRYIFPAICLILSALILVGQAQPVLCRATAESVTDAVLQRTSRGDWLEWIESLSGAQVAALGGEEVVITTRYSPAMFGGYSNARAFEYVLEQVRAWYPENQIEIDAYDTNFDNRDQTWKNLIVTLPGAVTPDEQVILSAHLDSVVYDGNSSYVVAPGAEDNGSGSAVLLEAARLFRGYRFERTIKIIWFTGEEQGLRGSKAYVKDHDLSGVQGVINLDMFGYDTNDDRCFELHVGTLPSSHAIGEVFARAARTYSPSLTWDTIAYQMNASDHASFLTYGIGAIEILENFTLDNIEGGCQGQDKNPHYHKDTDTTDKLNLESGFAIVRAALAAFIDLAKPVGACLSTPPEITSVQGLPMRLLVTWNIHPQVDGYEIYRSLQSCVTASQKIAELSETSILDGYFASYQPIYYQVVAIGSEGSCVSLPSVCQMGITGVAPFHLRFPAIEK